MIIKIGDNREVEIGDIRYRKFDKLAKLAGTPEGPVSLETVNVMAELCKTHEQLKELVFYLCVVRGMTAKQIGPTANAAGNDVRELLSKVVIKRNAAKLAS